MSEDMVRSAAEEQPSADRLDLAVTPNSGAPWPRGMRGPVQTLCEEIGFTFDRRLERRDVFVAFVRELVIEVDHMRYIQTHVGKMGGKGPSEGSAEVLALANSMLDAETPEAMQAAAEAVHDASWRLNPDEAYPTDHLIDMLSACASAIRFGLREGPCASRHAAAAAQDVWKQRYGVTCFDRHTPDWEKSWAREKLIGALTSLLSAAGVAPEGASQDGNRLSAEGRSEAPASRPTEPPQPPAPSASPSPREADGQSPAPVIPATGAGRKG